MLFSVIVLKANEIQFHPDGGIHKSAVSVELKCEYPNAKIYYTLDGSEPTSASFRYTKPIDVKTVAVIRAIAYSDSGRTAVITKSYFCDRDYTLPIVSISTNPANLWDFATGIYVKGCCADTIPPYLGANFWYDWERRANIEMYEPDGTCAFNQEAGIGIFGGFSKGLPQKSLYVVAREKYGKKKFDYPIFPEREHKKYKSFILRNAGGDFGKTHFRDAFMTQLAKPTGLAIQAYRPAIVFLNGQYWGIQNLREKINEHYLEANFGVDKDNVDLMEHRDGAKHGNSKQYKYLLSFLSKNDFTKDENVAALRKLMNIEDYFNYNIAEIYSDNRDAGGNIRYFKERNDSSQWRWIFYDTEMGLGNNNPNGYKNNTLKKFTSINNEIWPDPPWSTFIIRTLLTNKKLEQQYINTFADQLNTIYHADTAVRLMNKMIDVLRPEMSYHQKRWGTTMKAWDENIAVLRTFIVNRPFYLRNFLMEKFDLKDTVSLSFVHPGKSKCRVTFNSLELEKNFEGVYFKDVPIAVKVEPLHDYKFVGWKDRNDTSNYITILPEEGLKLIPILEPKPLSKWSDSIIFNELCFYQPNDDTTGDWIELYNRSNSTLDLSGWVFTDSDYENGFIVPQGTTVDPKNFIVIAEYADLILSKASVIGDLNFGLSSKSEHLKIYDHHGLIVDSLTYVNTESEEKKFSYNLVHPDSSGNSVTAWSKEDVNPGEMSFAYKDYLKSEEEKAYWTNVFFIGGGGFFFILVVGLLLRRYFKNNRTRSSDQ